MLACAEVIKGLNALNYSKTWCVPAGPQCGIMVYRYPMQNSLLFYSVKAEKELDLGYLGSTLAYNKIITNLLKCNSDKPNCPKYFHTMAFSEQ